MPSILYVTILLLFVPICESVNCSDGAHACESGLCCERLAGNRINYYCCQESCNSVNCSPAETVSQSSSYQNTSVGYKGGRFFCPHNRTICKDNQTCCKLLSGRYSCCPYKHGVCCANRRYCCPQHYRCHGNRCIDRYSHHVQKAAMVKIGNYEVAEEKSGDCPDDKHACRNLKNCISINRKEYGCCNYEEGVLCPDKFHCCPKSYQCSLDSSKCKVTGNKIVNIFSVIEPIEITFSRKRFALKDDVQLTSKSQAPNVSSVICPDGRSQCPDDYTCCLLSGGEYGCCPYSNAVCCQDHEHCCPEGMKCDVTQSRCISQTVILPMKKKIKATEVNSSSRNVFSVTCPDKQKQCPDNFTCCKLPGGDYGCCPQRDAVCCDDHIHCCPSGFKCSGSSCEKATEKPMARIAAQ